MIILKEGDTVRLNEDPEMTGVIAEDQGATDELKVRFDSAPNDVKVVGRGEVTKYDAK